MKLIEFVFTSGKDFRVGIFDLNDISSLEQQDEKHCLMVMKDRRKYILPGTHRALTNRFIYGFGKVIEPHQDIILRPSIRFYHKPEEAESDVVFFDEYQFKCFQIAMQLSL